MVEKYLSNSVHSEEIEPGYLNIVCAPCGSGKSYWSLNELSKTVSKPYKMLYLISTTNGRNQLLKKENTMYIEDGWIETVVNNKIWFGDLDSKVVVMTYYKFGILSEKYSDFGYSFEIIVADEIQDLPRFNTFNPSIKNYHRTAKRRLESIINNGKVKVIGISATPKRAIEKMLCQHKIITVDEDIKHYKPKNIKYYTNINYLLNELPQDKKGIVYIQRITQMIEFWKEAENKGFKAIAMWSEHNEKNEMNDEQKRVINYIVNNSKLPQEYNLFIINASFETSINIYSKVDYMVIHSQEKDVQIQVQGRYRGNLDILYILDYESMIKVPDEFINRQLFKEERDKLCIILYRRDENNRMVKWTTIKKLLIDEGYNIEEGRKNNKRYYIITK